MGTISFKMIFRNWRRNKTFALISILSLAIGIACTNLLVAFVIHEYNIEGENPNKDRIYCIIQDSPMQSGDKVFYADYTIPPLIKDRYPEVEDYLRIGTAEINHIIVGETIHDPITILQAEPSFPRFFPYQAILGNLEEALSAPDKIALTEATARRFFGRENPIGQTVSTKNMTPGFTWGGYTIPEVTTYQVEAVIAVPDQSILSFDGITSQPQRYGGTSFLLMNQMIDPDSFALRLKEDGIYTLMGDRDSGRYYFSTLSENYFNEYASQILPYIRNQNKLTLYIGLFSALLILLIACFNYINLNFSRLLQQVRMIHIQKLMGASRTDINRQLFFDIFFTVLIAFTLSMLIMRDLVPVFNSIFSGQMKASFMFSGQVLPVLIGLILILSFLPAMYVSRKMAVLSRQHYQDLTGGQKKQGIISTLSVIQFTISIALIVATLTVSSQIGLIRQGGEAYRGLIEVGNQRGHNSNLESFVAELRTHPELGEINTARSSILVGEGYRQIVIPNADGSETYMSMVEFSGDPGILSMLHIQLQQGTQPEEALAQLPRPVYINRRFADVFVGKGENPIGKPLKSYDKDFDFKNTEDGSKENPVTIIAGIVDNFFIGSLEQEVDPAIIHIEGKMDSDNSFIYFRLDDSHPERLSQIKQRWEKHHPGELFTYRNIYQQFVAHNQKAFGLAELLLMYSLISIFLTCFGLFGMTLYVTRQRTKEIGIRKVNGSTTGQIMWMFIRRFIYWIGIAFVFATPITWYLMNRWLESFVYRQEMTVGIYLLAGLAVVLITLFTVSWHSYKAASANPVKALRSE